MTKSWKLDNSGVFGPSKRRKGISLALAPQPSPPVAEVLPAEVPPAPVVTDPIPVAEVVQEPILSSEPGEVLSEVLTDKKDEPTPEKPRSKKRRK